MAESPRKPASGLPHAVLSLRKIPRSDRTSAARRQGSVAGPAPSAGRRSRMPCVAGRNAQGRGSAGRRPRGAWERRWGLAPCTGIVARLTVGETHLGAVVEAGKELRSCGRKFSGSTMSEAMASSRVGVNRNERAASGSRVRRLALPEAIHGAGRMSTLLLRRDSNHGCGSRDVPAGAAGISHRPRMRLPVTRPQGATGRIRHRLIHWRGSPGHRSCTQSGRRTACISTTPGGLVKRDAEAWLPGHARRASASCGSVNRS